MKAVSETAFYCCGVRMLDAESVEPVCGDSYARRFMEGRGLEVFEQFRGFERPNAGNVARARMIDDLIRDDLARSPDRLVVTVGAGFDTRPFRLGGGRWVELDEPAVMEFKEQRLPARECPRPLTRVPIDFEREPLAAKLAPFAGEATVVMEGVLMYLDRAARRSTLSALLQTFPGHLAIADLMTREFFDRFAGPIHERFASLGATFKDLDAAPERAFLDLGYRHLGSWSTVEAARRFKRTGPPLILLRTLFRASAADPGPAAGTLRIVAPSPSFATAGGGRVRAPRRR